MKDKLGFYIDQQFVHRLVAHVPGGAVVPLAATGSCHRRRFNSPETPTTHVDNAPHASSSRGPDRRPAGCSSKPVIPFTSVSQS
jgi:hypothetical protein